MNINIRSNAWLVINGIEFYNRSVSPGSELEVTQHVPGWDFKTDQGFYNVSDQGLTLQGAIDLAEEMQAKGLLSTETRRIKTIK